MDVQEFSNILLTQIQTEFGAKAYKTAFTIIFLIVLDLIGDRLVIRRLKDDRARFLSQKFWNYGITIIGVLLVARIWFYGIQSLATFLGIFTAGLAIALKDAISNLAGWLFIMTKRPFKMGDRIEMNGIKGDVLDIEMAQFSLLELGNWINSEQSTGRIVYMPNSAIFQHSVFNYTKGFSCIWNELPVLITFESDYKKVKALLQKILDEFFKEHQQEIEQEVKRASRQFLLQYKTILPRLYSSVETDGILYTLRYLCNARQRRNSEHELWERILDEFAADPTIDFAYPTIRYYDLLKEQPT